MPNLEGEEGAGVVHREGGAGKHEQREGRGRLGLPPAIGDSYGRFQRRQSNFDLAGFGEPPEHLDRLRGVGRRHVDRNHPPGRRLVVPQPAQRRFRPNGRHEPRTSTSSPVRGSKVSKVSSSDDVQITDYGTVDMAVQDTDLAQVLEMLAIQSRKNIIAGDDVSATVTANLYDVTFYEALDSVLAELMPRVGGKRTLRITHIDGDIARNSKLAPRFCAHDFEREQKALVLEPWGRESS